MLEFLRAHSWKAIRFVTAGGTAAVVNLSILYACTELFHLWYIASACIAFCAAFVVSFTLQKWWTFRDRSTNVVNHQVALYLFQAFINLSLGTLLLYGVVEFVGLHYLLAQVIVQGLIACLTYFVYSRVIFTGSSTPKRATEYLARAFVPKSGRAKPVGPMSKPSPPVGTANRTHRSDSDETTLS